jgi:YD repeat-containing protein
MNHTLSTGVWDVTGQTEIHQVFDSPLQYVSSWYLSRIITNTNDTVDFTYEVEHYQLPVQETAVKQNLLSYSGATTGGDTGFGGTKVSYSCNKTVIRSYRLTGIVWKGGRMELGYTDREDIVGYGSNGSAKKVSTLKVYNTAGALVKDLAFRYDYFNHLKTGPYVHVEKRLKLTALEDCLTDTSYGFGYLEGDLPKKNTRNTDYWGYYNGSSQGVNFYPSTVHNGTIYTGGDKDPDFNFMKRGTLETILWPTGGTTRFVYETNKFHADSYYENRMSHNYLSIYKGVYGEHYLDYPETQTDTLVLDKRTTVTLRQFFEYTGIHSIGEEGNKFGNTNYPGFTISRLESSGTLTRLYTYPIPVELKEDGYYNGANETITLNAGTYVLKALQVVDEMYCEMYYGCEKKVLVQGEEIEGGGLRIARIEGERTVSYTYGQAEMMMQPVYSYLLAKHAKLAHYPFSTYSATYLMQHSESTTPMASLKNGNMYGYGTVTETFADGAKTIYSYYNTPESASGYPFLTPDINYYNGLLEMKQTYNAAGDEVKNESYSYSHKTADTSIYGFAYQNYGEAYPYTYTVEYPYVDQKDVTEMSDGEYREEVYTYTYDNNVLLKSETLHAVNDTYASKYFYAGDLSGNGYTAMKNKNMTANPVQSLLLKNGAVVAGKKTAYGTIDGMVVPVWEYTMSNAAPVSESSYEGYFESRLQYANYNAYGQPMQVVKDGYSRVYLWSYNGLYPVAEIRNATYSQVAGALGSSFITALLNKSVPTDSDISAIRALQNSLDDVEVTTYRYQPLVGVTEMTDCRGMTTGYTYDSAGRLSETWLKTSGNVETLSTYEYNYAE